MKLRWLVVGLVVASILQYGCGNDPARRDQGTKATEPAPTPNLATTVISDFGTSEKFVDFESAELRLGWRILRPKDSRFQLVRQGGLISTYPEDGLPLLEQSYAIDGREGLIQIVQAPERHSFRNEGLLTEPIEIPPYQGLWWRQSDQMMFLFNSGESVNGEPIRILVYKISGGTLSEDDLRSFVASLAFDPS